MTPADQLTDGDALEASTSDASLASSMRRSDEIEADLAAGKGARYRMLTGDRPTGRLHIGHYFGSLANRVRLQNLGLDTFVLIADYQVIYDRDGVGELADNVLNCVTDYLAIGIDPEKSTIFAHSAVPALNQLMLPFLSLVTDSELRRNPTVKDEMAGSNRPMSGLMLTFPVHQAADILFCKANVVPVGKDQLPHIEVTRVIARRFDERYGRARADQPVFPQADALLSKSPLLLGMDGSKMSKSRGNTIELGMTADETAKLIKRAVTDSNRTITYDPANRPEVSNLLMLAALCTDRDPIEIADEIGDGGGGGLKKLVTEAVNEYFAPIRARRLELAAAPDHVLGVLRQGNGRANEVADATLDDVLTAMQMRY
ncbi:tryptophan--tRNA ligase [Aestuariimicrobium sp. T2.26MG-19.2B]|uniref:tryptophan--tRNA ligase n=1 Tax=Aestuariimicrobium sp. T2.26MG-19.2B TaxID=3040679 RepID=UPI002477A8A1|nr:tryptophan--tRNA ligase [Aestuariimicrobium sp. T2.26MG-19.2B]CAI9410812.1 Tryptophan--tRNA ligase 2 [Aestuariimicrobium sp. T2.26MG-19.2B]